MRMTPARREALWLVSQGVVTLRWPTNRGGNMRWYQAGDKTPLSSAPFKFLANHEMIGVGPATMFESRVFVTEQGKTLLSQGAV